MMLVSQWKWAGAVALSLGMLACGSEDGPGEGDGGPDASEEGGSGNGGGGENGDDGDDGDDRDGGGGEDGESNGGGEDSEDGGGNGGEDGGGNGDAGGSSGDGGGGDPGETPANLRDLPNDGEIVSICYGDDDCNGDDLVCVGDRGDAPGQCSEDCKEDSDCQKIDGLEALCTDGQCLVSCGGDENEGDGPCPTDMDCADLSPVAGLFDPEYWCVYPEEGGSNDVAKLGKCDPDHGHGDCKGERMCDAPNSGADHGFCTDACEEDADCAAPASVSSVPVCTDDMCELDCSGPGATCPAGMNCINVNNVLNEVFRCVYID